MSDVNSQIRQILAKQGEQRSYDDLIILKSRISQMDFMKSVFSSLHPRQVDELCRGMLFEIYEANQYVFHQGDVGDKFYVVLSGSCDVLLKQKTGNLVPDEEGKMVEEYVDKVIFTCKPGSQFGERALDYDEPRAASIITTEFTELITITQTAYRKMLKSSIHETPLDQPGNKGYTLRVLSLTRDKRKANELHAVSEYLSSHVPFFKKFSKDQRIEICRMCELVKVWGKTVLFKQGSVGQAFYIVLTGSVDIIVTSTDDNGESVDINVNTLHEGASFGERALEAEDSLRTASIVTSEALTELIIINREEYQRIVAVMRQGDMMERVRLLRMTQLFGGLELPYLHDIAKTMDSKVFRLDSILFTMDQPAKDVYIINKGECHVDSLMPMENGSAEIVDLGRVGPGAVLGEYCLLAESYYDEVFFKETATATTYCCVFVLSKIDFFNTLNPETRNIIVDTIRNFSPSLTSLWDMSPRRLCERDWRITQTWQSYKSEVAHSKVPKGILHHLECSTKRSRDRNEPGSKVFSVGSMSPRSLLSSRYQDSRVSYISIPTPSPQPRFDLSPRISYDDKKYYSEVEASQHTPRMVTSLSTDCRNVESEVQPGELGPDTSLQQLPFALVQFHRNSNKPEIVKGARLSLKCFLRFCGCMRSEEDAKVAAEMQIRNIEMTSKNSAQTATRKKIKSKVIEWKRFNGFENMSLQHTDHFIIMCRSVPVETASFTPTGDLMELPFPLSCIQKSQKYCSVTLHDLKRRCPVLSTSSRAETEETNNPLYLREISCVVEVHAVSHTKIESLRFSVLALNPAHQAPYTSLLVVPLYTWEIISEDMINSYSCADYTASVARDVEHRQNREQQGISPMEQSRSARMAQGKMKQFDGVDSMNRNVPAKSTITSNLSSKHELSRVPRRRDIQSVAGEHEGRDATASRDRDHIRPNRRSRAIHSYITTSTAEKKATDIEVDKRKRSSATSFNDGTIISNVELGVQERKSSNSAMGRPSRARALRSVNTSSKRQSKSGSSNRYSSEKNHIDAISTLQPASMMKNVVFQSDDAVSRSARSGHGIEIVKNNSSVERRRDKAPHMNRQLDLLDEAMFHTLTAKTAG
eukprot:CAMPEP_0185037936 /NCGR_PEP_ID=MMETSP1103-20130426/32986_1 /TAXON_ID=36769 /ORGANISM="Paraphysomonas bandaiensis, Strain Caron Lab Isolate" /LENGTH=1097 /DNA_ID=CAMNT_0027576151 /DNA_START=155 /DNA_END=3448 /DNA_ORIENTATION=-